MLPCLFAHRKSVAKSDSPSFNSRNSSNSEGTLRLTQRSKSKTQFTTSLSICEPFQYYAQSQVLFRGTFGTNFFFVELRSTFLLSTMGYKSLPISSCWSLSSRKYFMQTSTILYIYSTRFSSSISSHSPSYVQTPLSTMF